MGVSCSCLMTYLKKYLTLLLVIHLFMQVGADRHCGSHSWLHHCVGHHTCLHSIYHSYNYEIPKWCELLSPDGAAKTLRHFILPYIKRSALTHFAFRCFFSNTLHDIFFHYFAQVIPSLRDPNFIKYRTGLQDMAYLIGGMFWGLLISSLGMIVLVAGLVFFLTWHGEHTHWHLLILLSSSRSDVPDPVMRTLSGQFSQPFSGAGPRCTR